MLAQQPFLLHSPDGQACPPATPAPAALAWVRARTGGRVLSAEPLAAGAVHHNVAITVDGNPPLRVVLRWSAEQRPQDDAPREAILREAAVLSLLERAGLRAPRLVAADPIGAECGVPTLLMTYLEGRQPDADTARSPDFVAQLAAAAHDIHGVDGTGAAAGALAPFRLYNDLVDPRPPRHSDRPALWERAFAAVPVGAPAAPAVFLHRDYHAGNTLWSGSTLSGVVDWNTASLGPAGFDLGHMRWNLAVSVGGDVADRFAAHYDLLAGREPAYHPYWDVVAVVDLLPEDGLGPAVLERLEPFLEAALTRL
ncbi:aminoglycoside phosphotransferase family protein [Streptomyces platensis]|uniref:phosphotransferase family protein n=1 Tax=Streptomyces platensis TaxID=58346 RepID=UPI002E258C11|nr:aminoglycoside phosphotransferase family protein [Streptomyces platensis]WUB78948.1 aminoglycoside phosphotransferase family protein [Streptomyces platensis]